MGQVIRRHALRRSMANPQKAVQPALSCDICTELSSQDAQRGASPCRIDDPFASGRLQALTIVWYRLLHKLLTVDAFVIAWLVPCSLASCTDWISNPETTPYWLPQKKPLKRSQKRPMPARILVYSHAFFAESLILIMESLVDYIPIRECHRDDNYIGFWTDCHPSPPLG